MKKLSCIFCLFFFLIFSSSFAQNAKQIFRQKLNLVENYQKGKETVIDELKASAKFLTEITKIQFEVFDSYEMSDVTSKKNLKDWKKWYSKNKNKLYWDDIDRKVKVKI